MCSYNFNIIAAQATIFLFEKKKKKQLCVYVNGLCVCVPAFMFLILLGLDDEKGIIMPMGAAKWCYANLP